MFLSDKILLLLMILLSIQDNSCEWPSLELRRAFTSSFYQSVLVCYWFKKKDNIFLEKLAHLRQRIRVRLVYSGLPVQNGSGCNGLAVFSDLFCEILTADASLCPEFSYIVADKFHFAPLPFCLIRSEYNLNALVCQEKKITFFEFFFRQGLSYHYDFS